MNFASEIEPPYSEVVCLGILNIVDMQGRYILKSFSEAPGSRDPTIRISIGIRTLAVVAQGLQHSFMSLVTDFAKICACTINFKSKLHIQYWSL